jgi:hypothetical protein
LRAFVRIDLQGEKDRISRNTTAARNPAGDVLQVGNELDFLESRRTCARDGVTNRGDQHDSGRPAFDGRELTEDARLSRLQRPQRQLSPCDLVQRRVRMGMDPS